MHEDIRDSLYRKQPIAQERIHEKLQASNNYKLPETWRIDQEKPHLAAGRGFRKRLLWSRIANALCRICPSEFLCWPLEWIRRNKRISDWILIPISMPNIQQSYIQCLAITMPNGQMLLCPMANQFYARQLACPVPNEKLFQCPTASQSYVRQLASPGSDGYLFLLCGEWGHRERPLAYH